MKRKKKVDSDFPDDAACARVWYKCHTCSADIQGNHPYLVVTQDGDVYCSDICQITKSIPHHLLEEPYEFDEPDF